ncbi:MAG: shikimate kinase [Syntrophomonadaceae bacterium]|jgi:shikimate kinase
MGKNIVLLGFMGTGKSSVGYHLAKKLGRRFVDMDREIEKITGMSITDMFKTYGEQRFRSEEELMALKLSRCSDLVIATGGGVVLRAKNITALRENGVLIRLHASPEVIFERVNRKKGVRPLLKKNLTISDIEAMLHSREKYYVCADQVVDTTGKEIGAIVNEIAELFRKDALDE